MERKPRDLAIGRSPVSGPERALASAHGLHSNSDARSGNPAYIKAKTAGAEPKPGPVLAGASATAARRPEPAQHGARLSDPEPDRLGKCAAPAASGSSLILGNQPLIVAIPAKNEADRIGCCLLALAGQTWRPDAVLLLLNDCTDGTATIVQVLSAVMPFRLAVNSHILPLALANAGNARRLAMQRASELLGRRGVLLTTDADGVVATDWIERNLLALSGGADLVCGRAVIDPVEAELIPVHLHADDALECELIELLDQTAALLDPDPADPWPRHSEASGASLAVTVEAFRQVGGIPRISSGEDRAFVKALLRIDARIRHDPTVGVTVSGRILGRAPGGMADTIHRRMRQQDEFTDDSVEPAADAYRRIDFRRRARIAWRQQSVGLAGEQELAIDLGIAPPLLEQMLNNPFFGTAWADIEAHSPFLARRRVRFVDLPRQIAYARQLLERHTAPAEIGS